MINTFQISVILLITLCMSEVWSAHREGWVNPLDFHSYDHVNKVMRTTTEQPKTYER